MKKDAEKLTFSKKSLKSIKTKTSLKTGLKLTANETSCAGCVTTETPYAYTNYNCNLTDLCR